MTIHPEPSRESAARRVLVFTATYNERDNIEELCERVLALDERIEMLVVDDHSPDGTGQVLDEMCAREPRLTVVHRPRKLGLGTAHKLAMLHAIRGGYDTLVTMDADFSHLPDDIPRLLAALAGIDGADFVTGSRYMRGGNCDYHGYRRTISVLANRAARVLLGMPLHEFTTSLRAYRVSMLERLDLSRIEAQGYSFFLESVTAIHRAGFRTAEIPIHFQDRRAGVSKIPRFEILNGMARLVRLAARRFLRARTPQRAQIGESERCPVCAAPWLLERFSRQGGGSGRNSASGTGSGAADSTAVDGDATRDVSAYRCTSVEHHSKPQVLACLGCGIQFVPGTQVPVELESLYAEVVDEKYLENEAGREKTFARVFDRIAPHLRERGRLLEVGCYSGVFLEVARGRGWEARGVEPSRWGAGRARSRGFDVHCGTVDDAEFAETRDEYDAVVFWDVLEHVRDPAGLLRKSEKLLAPNGVLCFSTLDIDNWFARVLGKRWPWLMDMHIFYFSRPVTECLLEQCGFEVEKVDTYRHWVSARYLCEKLARLLPIGLRQIAALGARRAPRALFLPIGMGDIKLYIARKPAEVAVETGVGAGAAAEESARESALVGVG